MNLPVAAGLIGLTGLTGVQYLCSAVSFLHDGHSERWE